MNGEPFERRVRMLREAWQERREMKRFAGSADEDSQRRFLLTLYGWANSAARDIQAVYGDELAVAVSPPPAPPPAVGTFRLMVAGLFGLEAALEEQPVGSGRWRVGLSVLSPDRVGASSSLARRRQSHWTRPQFDELVLSLLGSYERSTTGNTTSLPSRHLVRRTDGE